jgi:hypothetical protein
MLFDARSTPQDEAHVLGARESLRDVPFDRVVEMETA